MLEELEEFGPADRIGIAVMMGAPNLIRGGSHSGNVACADLIARIGWIFCRQIACRDLGARPRCRVVRPGALREGLRADLIRVALPGSVPMLKGGWVKGARVA
ncbi:MAG: hypothetical protein EA338_06495 [Roseinatronobacter sp.]|nr:MAG: hypothetical protein EA338_06495 [Roseinatronobacter sp.]